MNVTSGGEQGVRPEACPFCRSKKVSTLAKTISERTFWRCATCGEGWDAARLARETRLPSRRYV